MYVPQPFEVTDPASLHACMRRYPLGTLVTATASGIDANHIPFLVDVATGQFGTLHAHVARANPVWQTAAGTEALVIFHGPEAFISPSWYATKSETGKVVPTWNYVVVHARGVVRVIEDREWLRAHVAALTTEHEGGRVAPWSVADAPAEYIDRLLGAIIGIEIPIARLDGKWKVSQNRSPADRRGVIEALDAEGTDRSRAMADLVRRSLAGE
jgi:transcriptional regulator